MIKFECMLDGKGQMRAAVNESRFKFNSLRLRTNFASQSGRVLQQHLSVGRLALVLWILVRAASLLARRVSFARTLLDFNVYWLLVRAVLVLCLRCDLRQVSVHPRLVLLILLRLLGLLSFGFLLLLPDSVQLELPFAIVFLPLLVLLDQAHRQET